MRMKAHRIDLTEAWVAENRPTYDSRIEFKPDVGLLQKTLDWAEQSDEWFQGDWIRGEVDEQLNVCGATYCMAGHVATMFATPLVTPSGNLSGAVLTDEGEIRSMSEFAQEKLGLDRGRACELFAGGVGIGMVRQLINRYIEEAENA